MDADCFETQPLVRWTLKCPNCGASASLPMEMTCSDHKPVMVPDTPPWWNVGETPPPLMAATRDAAWYGRPAIDRGVKYHVCLDGEFVPACNPNRALLSEHSRQHAAEVPTFQRCRRPGCRSRWPS